MDETQPLLQNTNNREVERRRSDSNVPKNALSVDFDPDGDAENPLEWPKTFRWTVVALLAFMAFTV